MQTPPPEEEPPPAPDSPSQPKESNALGEPSARNLAQRVNVTPHANCPVMEREVLLASYFEDSENPRDEVCASPEMPAQVSDADAESAANEDHNYDQKHRILGVLEPISLPTDSDNECHCDDDDDDSIPSPNIICDDDDHNDLLTIPPPDLVPIEEEFSQVSSVSPPDCRDTAPGNVVDLPLFRECPMSMLFLLPFPALEPSNNKEPSHPLKRPHLDGADSNGSRPWPKRRRQSGIRPRVSP